MLKDFAEPELFTLNCPTQQILDVIANKWTVIIIYCLAYSPKRYKEIHRKIEGISHKVLTQSLRNLEEHGLVERRIIVDTPPKNVEYSLTLLGESLLEPLLELASWSRKYFAEVSSIREENQKNNQSL